MVPSRPAGEEQTTEHLWMARSVYVGRRDLLVVIFNIDDSVVCKEHNALGHIAMVIIVRPVSSEHKSSSSVEASCSVEDLPSSTAGRMSKWMDDVTGSCLTYSTPAASSILMEAL